MENNEILNEVHKGAKMGMESIGTIADKTQDTNFKKILIHQYNEYKSLYNDSTILLTKSGAKIEDISPMQNAMGWMGIQMNTMMDTSNNKLADMLIQGINMGIVKGNELINHAPNMPTEIKNLVNHYVDVQEKNLDELKKWL